MASEQIAEHAAMIANSQRLLILSMKNIEKQNAVLEKLLSEAEDIRKNYDVLNKEDFDAMTRIDQMRLFLLIEKAAVADYEINMAFESYKDTSHAILKYINDIGSTLERSERNKFEMFASQTQSSLEKTFERVRVVREEITRVKETSTERSRYSEVHTRLSETTVSNTVTRINESVGKSQSDSFVQSPTYPVQIAAAPKVRLAPGGAKLMVWHGLSNNGLPSATMIDGGETFGEANIKTNPDIAKALYGRQRCHRWEGYIEVKKDSVLKFNLKRMNVGINGVNLPSASLSINDTLVISMKSERANVNQGQTPPQATTFVLVSLVEGYHKITIDLAFTDAKQSIDVTYGLQTSANERKITPKSMFYEIDDEDF